MVLAWRWWTLSGLCVPSTRPLGPIYTFARRAASDAGALGELDMEHWKHYTQAPVFMPPAAGMDAAANAAFLSRPKNSVWTAWDGDVPVGFLRFEGYDFDSVAVLESGDGVFISGAYVRPAYRGRRAAVAMLDAALRALPGARPELLRG